VTDVSAIAFSTNPDIFSVDKFFVVISSFSISSKESYSSKTAAAAAAAAAAARARISSIDKEFDDIRRIFLEINEEVWVPESALLYFDNSFVVARVMLLNKFASPDLRPSRRKGNPFPKE
jgi:hypothetical protein